MSARSNPRLLRAMEIARAAGSVVLEYYRAELAVHIKEGDARNLVTDADLAADSFIQRELRAAFPRDAILSEERYQPGDEIVASSPTWLVDPIDGTSNFAHEFPLFAICLGLLHEGRAALGVIHAPVLGWTFVGAAGEGATLDDLPLKVSERDALASAIVACDWPRAPALRRVALATYTSFGEQAHTLRSMGSAALGLAAVAAGWVDLYFNYSLMPWDTTAGVLLVREAGGTVTGLDGAPWRAEVGHILASNGRVHDAALRVVAEHLPPDP